MAWTTKSDRFGGAGSGTTAAQHIGPGHYKLADTVKLGEHGYAPFGSTNPRATSSKEGGGDIFGAKGPDPGAYDPKLPDKYDSGLPRKSAPFGVSATRIPGKGKMDFRPGPGTYLVDPGLGPAEAHRTMGIVPSGKAMLRSSSAPSIPQSHQSYGYEEVGGGRLVRQGPKDPSLFCSGRPDNSAGPGQYDPSPDPIRKRQVNGAFMKGPARLPLSKTATEAPGPGHYQAPSSLNQSSNTFNFGSSFASQTDRGGMSKREEKRKMDSPGPGQYVVDRAARPDLRELRSELQYFGSTVERFKTGGSVPTSVPDSLGPGSYASILNRKPVAPNARGFSNTAERFKADEVRANGVPGPGQYQLPGHAEDSTGHGKLATFSMLGNSGGLAFGTMNKRFTYASDEGKPGPGAYGAPGGALDEIETEPEYDPKGKSRRRPWKASRLPGSAFASKTPKDLYTKSLVKEGLQKPPPGAYDPVLVKDQATVVRLRSKSEGFLSGAADRFMGGPLSAPKGYSPNVGPGKYLPGEITCGKRFGTFNRSMIEGMPEGGRPRGLGFESQDKRFKTAANAKHPGPGQYNTDPGWITKSHNCYFGDLT